MALLATFADLDPLLQLLGLAVGGGIIIIVGFQLWRFGLRRRLRRKGNRVWVIY